MKSLRNTLMVFCIMLSVVIIAGQGLASATYGNAPSIDGIEMSPTVPEVYDSITCSVDLSDIDGDLEEVRFKWYRNTIVVKTQYLTVSGSSDTEHDTLSSSYTKEGDQIRCLVDVFDESGRSDSADKTVRVQETGSNNPPELKGIPDKEIEIGDTVETDLWAYATDIEDSDDELDFIHSSIIQDDYSKYIREIDDYFGIESKKTTSTALLSVQVILNS